VSKRNWFYFVLPCYTIGLKNSRHFLIQKEVKVKPIVTCSHFSAFRVSYMYLLSVLIGLLDYLCPVVSDYIGSGFMTPIENCSIFHVTFISTLNAMYKFSVRCFLACLNSLIFPVAISVASNSCKDLMTVSQSYLVECL